MGWKPRERREERRRKRRELLPPSEHAWERQPTEPKRAWLSFVVYRDLDPAARSIVAASKVLKRGTNQISGYSAEWDWVARCAAYDAWKDRQVKLAEVEEIKAMKRRHVQMAMSLQGAAALALNKIIEAERAIGPDGRPGPLTLKPNEVKELADLGVKLERLSRGEPDAIEEIRTPAPSPVSDYSALTLAELRDLHRLATKARGGKAPETAEHEDQGTGET